jgi:predicted dienelactone hydrolase
MLGGYTLIDPVAGDPPPEDYYVWGDVTIWGIGLITFGPPTAEQQATLLKIREEEAIVQAADLRFALSMLPTLDTPVRTHMDLRNVGVFGHSRGGDRAAPP